MTLNEGCIQPNNKIKELETAALFITICYLSMKQVYSRKVSRSKTNLKVTHLIHIACQVAYDFLLLCNNGVLFDRFC